LLLAAGKNDSDQHHSTRNKGGASLEIRHRSLAVSLHPAELNKIIAQVGGTDGGDVRTAVAAITFMRLTRDQ
jgi:hypothetical protein